MTKCQEDKGDKSVSLYVIWLLVARRQIAYVTMMVVRSCVLLWSVWEEERERELARAGGLFRETQACNKNRMDRRFEVPTVIDQLPPLSTLLDPPKV